MNIESYVFLICYAFLGITALFAVGRIIALEKELERKRRVIKSLQNELRIYHYREAVRDREMEVLRGEEQESVQESN